MFIILNNVDTLKEIDLLRACEDESYDILFNVQHYIDDIYQSYANDMKNVKRQVNLDFHRMSMIVDYEECTLKKLLKKHPVVVLLSTQASFFTMLYIIHILYGDIESDIHVIDLQNMGTNNSFIELINNDSEHISMTFFRVFGLMHTVSETLIRKISVTMTVDIALCGKKLKDIDYTMSSGIIYWKFD